MSKDKVERKHAKRKKSHSAAYIAALICFIAAAIFTFVLKYYSTIGLMLFVAGIIIIVFSFVKKLIKVILSILLACGLACFLMAELPVLQASQGSDQSKADYLVVLGAAVHGDTPSRSLTDRLSAAYDYLIANPSCTVVVSGGQGEGENVSEGQAMYDWLVDKGIDPSRIIKEEKSTSTVENLKNSFELIKKNGGENSLEGGNVAVLSSEYHLFRTDLLAQKLGFDIKTVAAPTTRTLLKINQYLREGFAVAYTWVCGA